jgi:replicative DNA helicase
MVEKVYSTGLQDLDKMLGGGLHAHSLLTIGARPSMGKTALMLTIASNLLENEIPFAYFSLGESAHKITRKLISNFSGVDYEKCVFPLNDENQIKFGLTGEEFQRVVYAINKAQKESHVVISDDRCSISELIESLEVVVKQGVSVIFIDYFQVLAGIRAGDVYQESSKMINELKLFANLNNVTIALASQLSRKVEERPGHRPMMTDFRDTGSIEEASDQILFLLRREYYDPMDKPGMGELIIAKNRFGSIGSVNVTFRKEIGRFEKFTSYRYSHSSNAEIEEFSHFNP